MKTLSLRCWTPDANDFEFRQHCGYVVGEDIVTDYSHFFREAPDRNLNNHNLGPRQHLMIMDYTI